MTIKNVLRSGRKRKQGKCFGNIEIVDRAAYQSLELDTKVALIRGLIPLGLMHIQELLDDEVIGLTGPRYARKNTLSTGVRHGTNPGSPPSWSDNGCQSAPPPGGCGAGARAAILLSPCRRRARSMRHCFAACSTGSRAATMRPQPKQFLGPGLIEFLALPRLYPSQCREAQASPGARPGRRELRGT